MCARKYQRTAVSSKEHQTPSNSPSLLALKTLWRDGTRAIALTRNDSLEKLTVLVPKPETNQRLYHSVFAPNSKYRVSVIRYSRKQEPEDTNQPSSPTQLPLQFASEPLPIETAKKPNADRPSKWADLTQKAFKIDVLPCDCRGRCGLLFVTAS